MMSLWDALRMNMMISYQELVRTFPNTSVDERYFKIYLSVTYPPLSINVVTSNGIAIATPFLIHLKSTLYILSSL
ncbi:hypothetical protein EI013_16945 [Escherichia coli]|nr:hypothetical protein [Escherichia coli]